MKRLLIFSALLALVMASSLAAQSTLRRTYRDLNVDVWTDHDDGTNYSEGDNITIYFRASQDAYVTIYDLDSRGNVNLIFPPNPGDNNYVQAGEVYQVPDPNADYSLTLEGPPGNENIQMIASTDFYPVPDWQGPVSVYDDIWGFKYDGDNDRFISDVNEKYFSGDSFAFDHVNFYVAPKYYYRPDRADCVGGDCGQAYIDYPDGCEVYVDGVFYGYAPLYVPGIYLGRHRVTVYWGPSVVYNDWIFVNAFDPFCIYTRPNFIYRYCYDNWYHHRGWDNYWDGPSRFKYKDRDHDYYFAGKPQARRGYQVIENDHGRYEKSKSYQGDKEMRIKDYKQNYGFDAKTKTYTASKYNAPSDNGKKYYNADAYGKQKDQGNRGTVENKSETRGKYYQPSTPAKQGDKGGYQGKQPVGDRGKAGNVDRGKSDRPAGNTGDKGAVDKKGKSDKSGNTNSKEPAARPEKQDRSGGGKDKSRSDGNKYYQFTPADNAGHARTTTAWQDRGQQRPNSGQVNRGVAPRPVERQARPTVQQQSRPRSDGNTRTYNAPQPRSNSGNSGGSRPSGGDRSAPSSKSSGSGSASKGESHSSGGGHRK